jgi:hypothetical protein
MTDVPSKPNPLDAYALAVGQLCNQWAQLETTVRNLVIRIGRMNLEGPVLPMMRCYAFRDHLTAIRIGAVASGQNQAWIDGTVEAIDYIENVLRNRRNRFVHDQWVRIGDIGAPSVGVGLINFTPKVKRAQSRMPLVMIPGSFSRHELSEVTETTEEVVEHRIYLGHLISYFGWPLDAPLPPQLATPPRRRYLRRPQETPSRKGTSPQARKRPPRSSPV